ncbi:MAG: hypothetical protein GXY84_01315 [Clostridiales bacterium]|nr:hypothetical protein [Clostridiales bacterium]
MKHRDDSAAALLAARDRLGEVTPLHRDCGALCAAACCAPDDQGRGGMLLHPGEEACYRRLPAGFAIARDDSLLPEGRLLTCQGHCQRHTRPLACRIFPLMFTRAGAGFDVRLDPRAWPLCPLMPSGIQGLRADFVQAAREAAAILARDAAQAAFLDAQDQAVRALARPLWGEEGQP